MHKTLTQHLSNTNKWTARLGVSFKISTKKTSPISK